MDGRGSRSWMWEIGFTTVASILYYDMLKVFHQTKLIILSVLSSLKCMTHALIILCVQYSSV